MRPYQSNQEEEDPDIKKIKKVNFYMSWKIHFFVPENTLFFFYFSLFRFFNVNSSIPFNILMELLAV